MRVESAPVCWRNVICMLCWLLFGVPVCWISQTVPWRQVNKDTILEPSSSTSISLLFRTHQLDHLGLDLLKLFLVLAKAAFSTSAKTEDSKFIHFLHTLVPLVPCYGILKTYIGQSVSLSLPYHLLFILFICFQTVYIKNGIKYVLIAPAKDSYSGNITINL